MPPEREAWSFLGRNIRANQEMLSGRMPRFQSKPGTFQDLMIRAVPETRIEAPGVEEICALKRERIPMSSP